MSSPNYKFADFMFRTDEETLYRAGVSVKLHTRTNQVLRVLLENPGRIIKRKSFLRRFGAMRVSKTTT